MSALSTKRRMLARSSSRQGRLAGTAVSASAARARCSGVPSRARRPAGMPAAPRPRICARRPAAQSSPPWRMPCIMRRRHAGYISPLSSLPERAPRATADKGFLAEAHGTPGMKHSRTWTLLPFVGHNRNGQSMEAHSRTGVVNIFATQLTGSHTPAGSGGGCRARRGGASAGARMHPPRCR